MIYKNAQIGKTKNITLIELGNGDVQVATIHCLENKYAGVEFVNDTPHKIGKTHNLGPTTDNSNPQAMLIFTKIESIEIVERALRKAKKYLKHIKRQNLNK